MKIHRNLMLVCLLLMASISYAQSETIVVGKKADGTDLKAQCYTFPQRVETFSMSDKGDYLCVSFRETTKSGKYLKNKGEIGFYDTKSSQLLWKQPIDFSKSRITCLSEGVLITEIGSKISLLSRETGAKRWEASLFPVYVDDSLGLVLGYNSPTSNKLRAVNLKFGNDLWENKIPHQYGWNEVLDLYKKEHDSEGGVLDIDTKTISTVASHEAGYIDKDLEDIVGLQTDSPLKRAIMPFGGM